MKKHDLAIIDYNKVIELNPNHAYTYNNLAFIYVLQEEIGLAKQNAEKSKNLDVENSWVYFTFAGIALLENKEGAFYQSLEIATQKGFPLYDRLDEFFLAPYLEEEAFKVLVQKSKERS